MDPQSQPQQPFPPSNPVPPMGGPAPDPGMQPPVGQPQQPFPPSPQPTPTTDPLNNPFPPAETTPAAPISGVGASVPAADPFAAAPASNPAPAPTVSGMPPLDQAPQVGDAANPAPSPMSGNVSGKPATVPSMAGMSDTQSGGGGKRKLIGIGLILFAIIVLIGLLLLIFKK